MDALDINRVFSMASKREMEANAFYSKVANSSVNPDVKAVFEQLAQEELGHFDLIEKLKNDPTMSIKMPPPQQDYKLAEATELPSLEDVSVPKDAIALAMKKEQQAVEFYRNMADSTQDNELKDIFQNLANMELTHKHRLETVFVDIGYPESF